MKPCRVPETMQMGRPPHSGDMNSKRDIETRTECLTRKIKLVQVQL